MIIKFWVKYYFLSIIYKNMARKINRKTRRDKKNSKKMLKCLTMKSKSLFTKSKKNKTSSKSKTKRKKTLQKGG